MLKKQEGITNTNQYRRIFMNKQIHELTDEEFNRKIDVGASKGKRVEPRETMVRSQASIDEQDEIKLPLHWSN